MLFNDEDLFDLINKKYKDKSGKANFNLTYNDLEEHFMKPVQLFNSKEKNEYINKNMKTYGYKSNKLHSNKVNINNKDQNSLLSIGLKIRTVNFYDLYKENKI